MLLQFAALAKQAPPIPPSWRAVLLMPLVALLGILLFLGITKPTYAVTCLPTVTVSSTGDSGVNTLRQAITNVCAGGRIIFHSSLNNSTITVTTELVIGKNIFIDGPGASLLTIFGNDVTRIFNISSGYHVNLDGLTLRDGYANSDLGGAIKNSGTLTITDGILRQNSSLLNGGAIFNAGVTTLISSELLTNTANAGGGGLYNATGATMTLSDTVVSGNHTTLDVATGGGIYNQGHLTLNDSTINDNSTAGSSANGAGIYTQGVLTMTESIVQGNRTSSGTFRDGGGIFSEGTTTIESSFIGDNFAGNSGGGIFRNLGALNVTNTTIYSNSTGLDDGGGVVVVSNANPAIFTHNTFAYNKAGNSTGNAIWNEFAEAISVTNSLFLPAELSENITATVSAQCSGMPITGTAKNMGLESSCNSTGIPISPFFRMGELGTYGGNVPQPMRVAWRAHKVLDVTSAPSSPAALA